MTETTYEQYLDISVKYSQSGVDALITNDCFANSIKSVLPEGGCILDYDILGFNPTLTDNQITLRAMIVKEDDSAIAETRIHNFERTNAWLRKTAKIVRTALHKEYSNIEICLVTLTSTAEML